MKGRQKEEERQEGNIESGGGGCRQEWTQRKHSNQPLAGIHAVVFINRVWMFVVVVSTVILVYGGRGASVRC